MILEIFNELMSALELQMKSREAEIVAKIKQINRLEGHHQRAEEWVSLLLATNCEHEPQLLALSFLSV